MNKKLEGSGVEVNYHVVCNMLDCCLSEEREGQCLDVRLLLSSVQNFWGTFVEALTDKFDKTIEDTFRAQAQQGHLDESALLEQFRICEEIFEFVCEKFQYAEALSAKMREDQICFQNYFWSDTFKNLHQEN